VIVKQYLLVLIEKQEILTENLGYHQAVARQRSYVDACATAHALDLIGERWALLVVRDLLLGPKRFTDLKAGIPDISPNVLGQRLRELEAAGIVQRRTLPPPAASRVYELTVWGQELEPVVVALGRWGSRSPTHPRDGRLSVDSLVLALKADFDPGRVVDDPAEYEIRLEDNVFGVRVADGTVEVARGAAAAPVATLTTDVDTMTALMWTNLTIADALEQGTLRLEGSRSIAKRFLALFPAPEPYPLPASSGGSDAKH
jgi:DNA-binding HxlR family transcriptional regulator